MASRCFFFGRKVGKPRADAKPAQRTTQIYELSSWKLARCKLLLTMIKRPVDKKMSSPQILSPLALTRENACCAKIKRYCASMLPTASYQVQRGAATTKHDTNVTSSTAFSPVLKGKPTRRSSAALVTCEANPHQPAGGLISHLFTIGFKFPMANAQEYAYVVAVLVKPECTATFLFALSFHHVHRSPVPTRASVIVHMRMDKATWCHAHQRCNSSRAPVTDVVWLRLARSLSCRQTGQTLSWLSSLLASYRPGSIMAEASCGPALTASSELICLSGGQNMGQNALSGGENLASAVVRSRTFTLALL